MGFFDDLVLPAEAAEPADPAEPAESATPRETLAVLAPYGEDAPRDRPPVDWFAPALVPQLAVAGAGPAAKVLVTGWSVWPGSVTLHLAVHRSVHRQSERRGRRSGLRVGLALGDGRRVTTLDTPETRVLGPAQTWAVGRSSGEAGGLVALDPGTGATHRTLFRVEVDLYLPQLPPPGETRLVVEWPDEEIAETVTPVDAASLRAASTRAVEVWPDLPVREPASGPSLLAHVWLGGPPDVLATPVSAYERRMWQEQEEARVRYVPKPHWEGMRYQDWGDERLLRARLDGGAPADARVRSGTTPLHLAAEWGDGACVAALLPHVTEVDARDDEGHTALWHAVRRGDEGSVRALIRAGADVWTPQCGTWSPGRLLLTTPLAPLAPDPPDAAVPSDEERAVFRAADELVRAFGEGDAWTEGLGVTFVRGLDEDEVIRRLCGDPVRCPVTDPEHVPFDEDDDYEASLRHVTVAGLPGDPGGCVITQDGYMPGDDAVLAAISPGTAAYGIYFNPKGGTHGVLARDGRTVHHEEIGLSPDASSPPAHWHFGFWRTGSEVPRSAQCFAYACAAAGLRVTDGRAVLGEGGRRRWVELPPELLR